MTDNDFLSAECRREYGALLDKHTQPPASGQQPARTRGLGDANR